MTERPDWDITRPSCTNIVQPVRFLTSSQQATQSYMARPDPCPHASKRRTQGLSIHDSVWPSKLIMQPEVLSQLGPYHDSALTLRVGLTTSDGERKLRWCVPKSPVGLVFGP